MMFPVMASARALAPSSPILLYSRLKRAGKGRRKLNNILIHLHNYTAGMGGYCIVVGGEVGFGLGWNRGVDYLTRVLSRWYCP